MVSKKKNKTKGERNGETEKLKGNKGKSKDQKKEKGRET